MKIFIPIAVVFFVLNLSFAFSQTTGRFLIPKYVPADSSKPMWEIGAGLGVPYGTFGGKLSAGNQSITGDIGFGILPFAWTPGISLGGSIHFGDRYANFRPKITVTYSNIVGAILMLESGGTETLYDETFAGIGIYAGFDWRIMKTLPFCLDVNIGWTFPFVGNDEMMKRYNDVRDDLINRGYMSTDDSNSLETVKISIGITYSPKRKLQMIF